MSIGASRAHTLDQLSTVSGYPATAARSPTIDVRLDAIHVLVVDDQLDSREMVATALQQRGAIVSSCDSATAALEYLATHAVSVLIADIAMPQLDGYELMRRLRADGRQIAAIAVTAFARPEDRRLALEAGYLKYLAKPVDASELADAVRELADAINPAADPRRPESDRKPLQPQAS